MAKQVFDFRPSAGITTNQSNEHQRRWSEKNWQRAAMNGNYDRTRAHLNFEISKGGVVQPIDQSKSIPRRIRETLAEREIVDPNEEMKRKGKEPNRRTVVNIIFGGSREQMHHLAFSDQTVNLENGADNSNITRCKDIEDWAKDIYAFVCDKWGEDNIVGFYVHCDELNPHIHCTLLPINQQNKFAHKTIFAGENKSDFRERTIQLHNELAVVNAKWGLDRGQSVRETGARHRSTEQYRAELHRECNDLELEIAEKHETLRDLYADIHQAETRCKGLNTMIANLENREADLNDQIDRLEADHDAGNGDAEELRQRIANLRGELRTTESSLEDKRQKLKTADKQLAKLQDELKSVNEKRDNAARTYHDFTTKNQEQMRMRLTDAVFGRTVVDMRSLIASMTPEQKAEFDGEFLMAMAEKPNEILKCAMYLFMGYLDGASQFAQSCGGGGSSSDLPWGRKDDEDDRRFAYRCMMQAHKMLKPASPRRGIFRR